LTKFEEIQWAWWLDILILAPETNWRSVCVSESRLKWKVFGR
jgi:hypothetical protein